MYDLTDSQVRFFELIEQSSCSDLIMSFYDLDKRAIKLDELQKAIPAMSPSESLMNQFLANIWLGRKEFDVDLIFGASSLDSSNAELISDWFSTPFFP